VTLSGLKLALKGLASILRRKLGQNRKSVMKVVTLKNIPEVPAPSAAEPTDRYSGPVPRDALNRSGSVAIPRMAGNGAQRLSGYGARLVDDDLALRWKGSASPEMTMAAENPTPSEPLDLWNRVA
jgi:hypothetical protein